MINIKGHFFKNRQQIFKASGKYCELCSYSFYGGQIIDSNKKKKMSKKKSNFQGLFEAKEQARVILEEIFERSTAESLNFQLYDLLLLHPDRSEIELILDNFKSLVATYDANDLLASECKIKGWENNPHLRAAISIGLAMLLVDICWNVFGEKLHSGADNPWEFDEESKETQMLRIMANYINIELFIRGLFDTAKVAVGETFYKNFQEMIREADADRRKLDDIEANRMEEPKLNIMLYMGWLRTFIEATFFFLYEPGFDKSMQ